MERNDIENLNFDEAKSENLSVHEAELDEHESEKEIQFSEVL
jgi:hypothetical protein